MIPSSRFTRRCGDVIIFPLLVGVKIPLNGDKGLRMIYPPGHILSEKYRIQKLLGRGAFAEVYLAVHIQLNAPRALKVLRKDALGLGSSEYNDFQQRFQLEAQLGAQLDHPNLVRVYDFEQAGDTLILVMEYCAGGSLAERIAAVRSQGQTLSVDLVTNLARDMARGLAQMHQMDLVHRDIKPSNILLTNENAAKVGDLGLAQTPGGTSQRSRWGSLAPKHPGTPGYMSPEQETLTAYLRPASDVYALGVVIFQALTGRMFQNIKPGTRLKSLRPDVPGWLDELLASMLDTDPKQRPWDGGEALRLLESGMTGEADLLREAAQRREAEERRRKEAEEQQRREVEEQQRREVEEQRRREAEERQHREAEARRQGAENGSQGIQRSPILWIGAALVGLAVVCLAGIVLAKLLFPDDPSTPQPQTAATATQPVAKLPAADTIPPPSSPIDNPAPTQPPLPTSTHPPDPAPTSTHPPEPAPSATDSPTHKPPASSEKIAFTSYRSGNSEIYIMNPDGQEVRRITFSGKDTSVPSWSPDRTQIAFQSNADGDFDIYTVSIGGDSEPQRLTKNTCDDWGPSWSPDGEHIAFYSKCDGNREIYVMRADGSGRKQLTETTDKYNWFPTWSPDGKYLTYSSNKSGSYHIYVMNADGTNQRMLSQGCVSNFSPDGKRILFSEYCTGDYGNILVMDVDGRNVKTVNANESNRNPCWSPDGNWIVYQSELNGNADIWIMAADGSAARQLTFDAAKDTAPDW